LEHGDGALLLTAAYNSCVLWDIQTGEKIKVFSRGHCDSIYSAALSCDCSSVVTGGCDGILKVWSIESGECIRTLHDQLSSLSGVQISPDGAWVLAKLENTEMLWSTRTGECTLLPERTCGGGSFSPDSSCVLLAHKDSSLSLWSIAARRPAQTFGGHTCPASHAFICRITLPATNF